MGVAYSSGLSKNGSWADHDAVFPILKVSLISILYDDSADKPARSILQHMDPRRQGGMPLHSPDTALDRYKLTCWCLSKHQLTLAVLGV